MSTGSAILTMADFFGPGIQDLAPTLEVTLNTDTEFGSMKDMLTQVWKKFELSVLSKTIAGKMPELLDIRLSDVLGSAWSKAEEIREAIQRTKQVGGETALIPLVEHTVKSEHRPYIDVRQGQNTLARITFQVSLDVLIQGAELRIERGRIQEILSGEAKAKGTVKLGSAKLLEKEIESLHIAGPVMVRFEESEGTSEHTSG